MKLDRNINEDGRGKYALIHIRKLHEITACDLIYNPMDSRDVTLPRDSIGIGGDPSEQFFVLKYKDEFAYQALVAYARAVMSKGQRSESEKEFTDLKEFADEIFKEADICLQLYCGGKTKIPD